MAVAARSPSPSDGRLPCPLCGGLVHPLAGRCKHCKADLAAQRGARPAATAALPPLREVAGQAAYTPTTTSPTVAAVVVALPVGHDESRPVLPPRPTGRMHASEPRRSIWHNWPMIVIVIAGLAIAVAVVLMVFPPSGTAKADGRKLPPPPAPERMETNPLPPQSSTAPPTTGQADPWSNRGVAPDPATPDIDSTIIGGGGSIDPDDQTLDPFANPRTNPRPQPPGGGGLLSPFGSLGSNNGFAVTIIQHACTRAKSCGNSSVTQMCDTFQGLFASGTGAPSSCVAATRCLEKVDQLDCSGLDQTDVMSAMTMVQDCVDAMQRC